MGDREVKCAVQATIGKRIGRYIQHAHDQRTEILTRHRKAVTATLQGICFFIGVQGRGRLKVEKKSTKMGWGSLPTPFVYDFSTSDDQAGAVAGATPPPVESPLARGGGIPAFGGRGSRPSMMSLI